MMSVEIGDILAPLIGAPRGSVVMLPNVTTAEAVVLSSFDYSGARNKVVTVDGEFPSVRYIYDRLAQRLGAEVVTIPHDRTGLGFDLERLLEAIDERTQLVPSFTGWMAHANPFGFEPPPMRFREDALRFALGTPPIPA